MTREEAIDLLDNLIGMVEDNHNSDYDKALKMAIKSLEQEPFINKPCISNGVCEHDKNKVLDKIRAEIEASKWTDNTRLVRNALASGLDKALEIIDKYKAEREE